MVFDVTIVQERHPHIYDHTHQLMLAALYQIHETLEKIMSNQDTIEDLATRLTTALGTLESQPAQEKVDYTPLESAVSSIETFVKTVVAAADPTASDGTAATVV